ncbi:MAG: radical SAM/SPASM domain-containing protein [Erysipelotrichaceae bacterium]
MIKRIYFEITNACNLNCPFCTNEKGSSFVDFETCKKVLEQIKEVCDYIYLHVLGEPLLHPDIDKILDYCDNLKLNVQLVTNGLLLSKNILNHPSLRKLSISLHSVNNIGISDSYFDNISEIIQDNKVNIELRFYDSEHLDERLKSYLNKLNKEYVIKETSRKDSYKLKDNVYIYFQEFFRWPDINDSFISSQGKCLGAVNQLAVLHDLSVTICCLDPKGYNKIGSLKDKSLKEIIESEEYKKLIAELKNNRLTKELCTKCSYRLRFDGRNS